MTLSLCLWLLCAPAPATLQTPTPLPRLRLDVERHVQEIADSKVPRFQIEVTGRTPQQAIEEHLEGFDVLCGPGGGGAPTLAQMAPYRPNSFTPPLFSVDLIKVLADLKKIGPDRYFLYRVMKPDGVSYLVREGRLPVSQLLQPGAILEPVAAFPDRATATRGWRRLSRGYKTAVAPEIKPCTPK